MLSYVPHSTHSVPNNKLTGFGSWDWGTPISFFRFPSNVQVDNRSPSMSLAASKFDLLLRVCCEYFRDGCEHPCSTKQCRERWCNYLDPHMKKGSVHWLTVFRDYSIRKSKTSVHTFDGCLAIELYECAVSAHSGWTPREDAIIFEQQKLLGNKWSRISKVRTIQWPLCSN